MRLHGLRLRKYVDAWRELMESARESAAVGQAGIAAFILTIVVLGTVLLWLALGYAVYQIVRLFV